jgi:hypothetical protein
MNASFLPTSRRSRIVTSTIIRFKSLWPLFLGYSERKKYVNNPDSLDALQVNIKHDIFAYSVEQLRHV